MKYLLLVCFFFHLLHSYSQTYLTLKDARGLLLEQNLHIQQSELQEKISKINLQQAYDAFLPNISLSVNNQNTMGLNFDQVTGQLITGNNWTNYGNATASTGIVFFQGFRDINEVRSNRLAVELSKLDTDKLKYELELQLISLYFQTLINLDLHQASFEQSKLSEQQLHEEEIKIEVGRSTLVDLAQARNKLANDQLNMTNTKNAYQLSLLRFKQLLEFDVEDDIQLVKPSEKLAEAHFYPLHIDVDNDIYLRSMDTRIKIAEIGVKIAKSGYYPTLSLNSGYSTNYSSRRFASPFSREVMPLIDQMSLNRSLFLNVGLSYNLFDKFTTRSNVAKSRINLLSLTLEKDRVTRERRQEMEQARMDYLAALEENKAVQSAYDASKASFEAMSERYNVGKSSSIDLYRTMTDYNIAEFQTITSKYNVMLKAEVLKLVQQEN